MSIPLLSFGLDILILFFLVCTVYYSFKLSRNLSNFRLHKQEFQALISDLNTQLNKAQSAIANLQNESQKAGRDMQDLSDESRMLIEELKTVNQVGEALAKRIENTSRYARTEHDDPALFMDKSDETDYEYGSHIAADTPSTPTRFTDSLPRRNRDAPAEERAPEPPSFFIRDPDHRDMDTDTINEPADRQFESRAEQELYDALRGRPRKQAKTN